MELNRTGSMDVSRITKKRGLNSFSIAPRNKKFQTETEKAAIEKGYFRGKKESEDWDTFIADDSTIESSSQPATSTSNFTSAGGNTSYVGIFAGKARALVNCCTSPLDRGGEAFKNDDIDIISNLNGNWNGISQGKVGYFKNLEVEKQKDNHKHRKNNIDLSKLPNKPKTLEELQKLIESEEYNNALNVSDSSHTLRREIAEVDINENLEHSSKLLNEAETLQDVEKPSDEEKFFEPACTSSPVHSKIADLINSPIKKIQVQPDIYDFPDEENLLLGSTFTSKKPMNATFINSDCDKLSSEPVPKGKESPKAALKRKKLERYRRKMAKVPICDIVKMCQM